jgi:hypothetical protein
MISGMQPQHPLESQRGVMQLRLSQHDSEADPEAKGEGRAGSAASQRGSLETSRVCHAKGRGDSGGGMACDWSRIERVKPTADAAASGRRAADSSRDRVRPPESDAAASRNRAAQRSRRDLGHPMADSGGAVKRRTGPLTGIGPRAGGAGRRGGGEASPAVPRGG